MPELVGFQTVVILDPYGITFNAVGVFGLDFQLLFKSGLSYCAHPLFSIQVGKFCEKCNKRTQSII